MSLPVFKRKAMLAAVNGYNQPLDMIKYILVEIS